MYNTNDLLQLPKNKDEMLNNYIRVLPKVLNSQPNPIFIQRIDDTKLN